MCANPAVSTNNDASSDGCARSYPAALPYFCFGFNHGKRSNLRRRINQRTIRHDRRRVNARTWRWHGIKQRSNTCPGCVWFARYDRYCCRWYSRCHIRMHNDSTGQSLIQCGSVTSVVQKANVVSSSRLQRGHTFKEQFDFIGNATCRARDDCKWIWPTSAKEPRVAQSCFDHSRSPGHKIRRIRNPTVDFCQT